MKTLRREKNGKTMSCKTKDKGTDDKRGVRKQAYENKMGAKKEGGVSVNGERNEISLACIQVELMMDGTEDKRSFSVFDFRSLCRLL
jgi:hypothetical protein